MANYVSHYRKEDDCYQTNRQHQINVAKLCRSYCQIPLLKNIAYITGLHHDDGKNTLDKWQPYFLKSIQEGRIPPSIHLFPSRRVHCTDFPPAARSNPAWRQSPRKAIVNVYANLHLKRTRIFAMMYHVNAGMGSANSFLVPHYPINPRL